MSALATLLVFLDGVLILWGARCLFRMGEAAGKADAEIWLSRRHKP